MFTKYHFVALTIASLQAFSCGPSSSPSDFGHSDFGVSPTTSDSGSDTGLAFDAGSTSDLGATTICDVPVDTAALSTFLNDLKYRSFAKQPAIHAAQGSAHAKFIQVYANPTLANEPAGATTHPVCSALIKELYQSTSDLKPFGWAVSVKTSVKSTTKQPGDGWFWFESGGSGSLGNPSCTGCHGGTSVDGIPAVDFVKTPLPLP